MAGLAKGLQAAPYPASGDGFYNPEIENLNNTVTSGARQ
jgi:hypothetical protein